MSFASFLRERRCVLGLTIHDTALAAGLGKGCYTALELQPGHRLPPPEVIQRLAGVLKVQPEEFLRAAGYEFTRSNLPESILTK